MDDTNHAQTDFAPKETPVEETPVGAALFRVMRALVFANPPQPEMDALPLAQTRLLWTVSRCPESTMKDYSERLGVSQSTVTQLADRLVRRGLIERQPDENDRRLVRLRMSTTGSALLDHDKRRHQELMSAVWSRLSEDERNSVLHGLDILAEVGEAIHRIQGNPLLPWPDKAGEIESRTGEVRDSGQPQPVFDLMTRRVRGSSPVQT